MDRIGPFADYVRQRKSKQTARAYKRGAERFERYCAELGLPDSLEGQSKGLIDNYVGWMMDQGLSPSTVRLMLAGTNAYIEWRKRQGEEMPTFHSPDLPKIEQKEPYALSRDELVMYWRACAMHPDPSRTILLLLPLCGLRSDEIVSVRMDKDIEVKGEWIVFHVVGKGGRPRSVPLLPQGRTILGQYIHGWRKHNKPGNPYLFPSGRGNDPFPTRSLRRHMHAVNKELDLKGTVTPHVLRKTYLTFLDKAGLSPFAIAKLAGHSSPKTTHESYIQHTVEGLIGNLESVDLPTPD